MPILVLEAYLQLREIPFQREGMAPGPLDVLTATRCRPVRLHPAEWDAAQNLRVSVLYMQVNGAAPALHLLLQATAPSLAARVHNSCSSHDSADNKRWLRSDADSGPARWSGPHRGRHSPHPVRLGPGSRSA